MAAYSVPHNAAADDDETAAACASCVGYALLLAK
jgi:hypothetical protein